MVATLPVIDLRADGAAAAIDRACRDVGFFLVTGHGADLEVLAALDAAARTFFALDDDVKAEVAMARGGSAWRGWFPEGGELTAGRPDRKEGCYFGEEVAASDPRAARPLHGPNLFPRHPADLGPLVLAWMDEMTALGHRLVALVGEGLGLGPTWFDDHVTAEPTTLFRIFRYPPAPVPDAGWGVAEHTDYGLLTILAHDGRPGLEVHVGDGWLPVPPIEGAFVVNLGDALERMTGGAYRSTPHRVRPPTDPSGADRLSFPFFFDPSWDAELVAVPVPQAPDDQPGRPARARWDGARIEQLTGTYGDYLTAKVARVFPQLGEQVLAAGDQPQV